MSEEAIKIFYSYSRKDLDMRNRLENHLAVLRRANRISTWHDLELEAGTEWEPAILNKLDTADIILLLVSSDFIASEYCYGTELKRAIARHDAGTARVIPIVLRPCDWNHPDVPFSKLNVLPTHAKAITSWSDRDQAFTIVAQRIRETVDQLRANKQAEQQAEEQQRQRFAQIAAEQQAKRERSKREQQPVEELKRPHYAELLIPQKAEAAELQRQRQEAEQRRQTDLPIFTRRQVLKWAVPAGVGIAGVTVASQFLGHKSRQPLPSSTPSLSPTTVDYSKLEGFLKAGQWIEADQETTNLMAEVSNPDKEIWPDTTSIQPFSCEALSKIDRLWIDISGGKFGFSVQKKIYVENCSGNPDGRSDEKANQCFGDRVGWRVKGQWIEHSDVTWNIQAPLGHLPFGCSGGMSGEWIVCKIFLLSNCNL